MKTYTAKRFCALIIALITAVSMFACDRGGDTSQSSETPKATNTETEPTQTAPESSESDTDSDTETETEGCEHPYAASAEGHWKPACDVCGKKAGKVQDHEIYEKIKDQGDRLAYIYLCSICDFVVFKQELSYDINVYIPPTDLAATRCYNYSGAYYFEDNVGFTRFTSSGAAGIIYAYEDTACEDVSGRYLVMKTRMSGGSAARLVIKSANAASSVSVTPCEIPEEWCTIIIDMAAIGNGKTTGYVPDGGGDYYLSLLDIYLADNTTLPAEGYMDISYITVVETLDDARDFAGENEVLYIYDNVMMNPFPTIEGAFCKHSYEYDSQTHSMSACENCGMEAVTDEKHKITESVASGVYSYGCECGYSFDVSKTVSSAVNTFLSPSYIAKHADNANCWSGGELMYEEGGEPFARIYGRDLDASGNKITDDKKSWNVYSNGIAVTGQYLVIKYRVPDNSLKYFGDGKSNHTQSQIRIYTSTQRNGATDEKDGFYLPVSEDNQWHVAITNLSFSVGNSGGSTYVASEDGTYTMKFLQLRLFYGGLSTATDYTDIAYIGFCDELSEAVSLVEETEYYWQCAKGERTGYTVDKAEGPNPEDEIPKTEPTPVPTPTPTEQHVITETVKNGVYSYSCAHCDAEINSLSAPSTINKFYSPKYLSTASGYNAVTNIMIDDDGTVFTRITGKNGGAFEYYLVDRSGAPATDAGAFRYLVFRIRVSNASKHLNAVFEMGSASTSVRLNNSMKSGEWVTLVLDMDKLSGIAQNSDGSYKIKHFRLYPQELGAEYVDVAYIAMCDDWTEVAPIAADETVTLITHTSNAGGTVSADDGVCLVHIPNEVVSNGTYTYNCSSCGETLTTKTVSENITKYYSASALASASGYNSSRAFLTDESGEVFARVRSNTGGAYHFYIVNLDGAPTTDIGKSTRYLMFKIRVSDLSEEFTFSIGTSSGSSTTLPLHQSVTKEDEWVTIVFDMDAIMKLTPDSNGKYILDKFYMYTSATGTSTFDIACVAFCDTWEEISSASGDSKAMLVTNREQAGISVSTADGSVITN